MDRVRDAITAALPHAPLIAEALSKHARGVAEDLSADLTMVASDVPLSGTMAKTHTYIVRIDANGLPRTERLIENICAHIVDYAISRSEINAATDELLTTKSTSHIVRLAAEAKNLFVDLAKTGEGGELLLFLLAEKVLRLPQILCKMSLKTSGAVHYHGSDGVHASFDDALAQLSLYWCESKMYASPITAITECFQSLSPYLLQPDGTFAERERDISLLQSHVNIDDPLVQNTIKYYFDAKRQQSAQVKYCGIALVGYDSNAYPKDLRTAQADVVSATQLAYDQIETHLKKRIETEGLNDFQLHILCIPFPSVDDFRTRFLRKVGGKH